MNPLSVSQHAVDRYLQRSNGKRELHAVGKLFAVADASIPIGKNRRYAKGWIVVVKNGVVKTAYRPRTREQMRAVHDAMKQITP